MEQLSDDQTARLIYLSILCVVLTGSYLASQRRNLGKTAQQAVIWGLIFIGVVTSVALWTDIKPSLTHSSRSLSDGTLAIPKSRDGHYYLTLTLNDAEVDFIIDTGASQIVLSQDDARKAGLTPETLNYTSTAYTANGPVETARVWLETVQLGDIRDTNVPATVNSGELHISLLGMSYLKRFSNLNILGDILYLER